MNTLENSTTVKTPKLDATPEMATQADPSHPAPRVVTKGVTKVFPGRRSLKNILLREPGLDVRAVDGVDLTINRSEIVGLIGGSGSGKSTLGSCLVHSQDITGGSITVDGIDVSELKGESLKAFRRNAQTVYQDPYGSLNPRLTVEQIVREPLKVHGIGDPAEQTRLVSRALENVRLPYSRFAHRKPTELSGGQRQRIAIARAVVLEPTFLIADEPVSMLDVSVQAGVLELLAHFRDTLGASILYVSHDVATVRYLCDRVAVMYHGKIVEIGPTDLIIQDPRHSYSRLLMAAVPHPDEVPTPASQPGTDPVEQTPHDCDPSTEHWIDAAQGHRWVCEGPPGH